MGNRRGRGRLFACSPARIDYRNWAVSHGSDARRAAPYARARDILTSLVRPAGRLARSGRLSGPPSE